MWVVKGCSFGCPQTNILHICNHVNHFMLKTLTNRTTLAGNKIKKFWNCWWRDSRNHSSLPGDRHSCSHQVMDIFQMFRRSLYDSFPSSFSVTPPLEIHKRRRLPIFIELHALIYVKWLINSTVRFCYNVPGSFSAGTMHAHIHALVERPPASVVCQLQMFRLSISSIFFRHILSPVRLFSSMFILICTLMAPHTLTSFVCRLNEFVLREFYCWSLMNEVRQTYLVGVTLLKQCSFRWIEVTRMYAKEKTRKFKARFPPFNCV